MISTFAVMAALRLPAALHGDFDHDGKRDTAHVVRSVSGDLQLVVWRGADRATPALVERLPSGGDVFVDVASAGRWPTACAKGHGRDDDPCPRKVVVTRGGELTWGTRESTLWVVMWDGRRLESVQLTD